MASDIELHKTSLRGARPSNEDVEAYKINLSIHGTSIDPQYAPIDFFVVCDGHGGIEVAEFVVPELQKYFMKRNLRYPLKHAYIVRIYDTIQQKLINHPRRIAHKCGCTALVLVRFMDETKQKHIQVVNLGDSRAVLSRYGIATPLCKDHKPIWSDEKHRIEQVNERCGINRPIHFEAGDWRVGDLSVSRSFGDLDNTPHVTHIPETFEFILETETIDEFIVLACDGVWDVMENHHVVNFVKDHCHNNNLQFYQIPHRFPSGEVSTPPNIARKLADYAIAKGSTDNISVLIIFLRRRNQ